jgi:hypothetical protein
MITTEYGSKEESRTIKNQKGHSGLKLLGRPQVCTVLIQNDYIQLLDRCVMPATLRMVFTGTQQAKVFAVVLAQSSTKKRPA